MVHIVNTFYFFYFNVLNKKHSIQLQINSIQNPINLDLLLAGDNYISYAENAVFNFVHAYISNIKRQRKSNYVNPMLNLYVINAWLFFSTYLLTIEIFYTCLFSFFMFVVYYMCIQSY